MSRRYAGILGPLAFSTALIRGLMHGGGFNSTMLSATLAMFLFGFIGFVAGQLAEWIVFESVSDKLDAEVEAQRSQTPAAATAKT